MDSEELVKALTQAKSYGLKQLKGLSQYSPLVFYYHLVSDSEPELRCSPRLSVARFRGDIQLLLENFKPLRVDSFLWHLRNAKPFPKGSFMLSFDDGLAECHSQVAPTLEEFKLDAMFFVNACVLSEKPRPLITHRMALVRKIFARLAPESEAMKDARAVLAKAGEPLPRPDVELQQSLWPRFKLLGPIENALKIDAQAWRPLRKLYMDEAQIDDLRKRGFTIGAHGCDHFLFRGLSLEDQLSEFAFSMKFAMTRFKPQGGLFAFPHSADGVSKAFFEAASRLGAGVEAFFGTSLLKVNPGMPWLIERATPELQPDTEKYLVALFQEELRRIFTGTNTLERP